MNPDSYLPSEEMPAETSASRARVFLNKVYMWMAACMLLTAGVAAYTAQDMDSLLWVMEHRLLVCLGTLGIVVVMSFGANRLSTGALSILLLTFAGVQGLLFGPVLVSYGLDSVGKAFGCTAAMFGGMSIFGVLTKRNLSTMGRMLIMLLIGLLVSMIVNIFWQNSMFDFVISCAGVVIFSLFTAYDTQNLLKIGLSNAAGIKDKAVVLGALNLYLDFINLFIMLLRLFGRDE
ncbi:MAG: Bax inhibitor-1/YccA family protein [Akkermansia sp.]|nr:Bax inhibitor-1/YccA family protein [Akkermansia sp.]